jgi:hypothetical protein
MKPKEHLNEQQIALLNHMHSEIQGFYESHDNKFAYALTGLLSELTKTDYIDERYVREKVELVV